MSFFAVPLSGLTASQAQLQSISNNLANVDTDGYKDQSVSFADLFAKASSVNGANDPIQTGQGVTVSATDSNFTNGTVSSTGIPSNMALQGDGFFVVQQSNGQVAYTRDGDFTANVNGQLVAPSGALVMGYPATNGVVSTSSPLQPLNVGTGTIIPGTATTQFTLPTNLDSSTGVGATYPATIGVYDSLGEEHTLSIDYTKTAANTWSYTITAPTADTGATNSTIATGNLTFDSSGNLTSPTGSVTGITIPSFTDGAAAMNLTWNLADSSGNSVITQTDIASGPTTTSTQNGTASASLTGYSILTDGTIEGTYSSGATQALGQVAVATVENDQGLSQLGGNLFQVTAGSGAASIGVAGTSGRATITGGSVEGSNVDEAAEFSNMIVAQQAYEANAKSVTTFDQVDQATLQMLSS
jgi:flagellar hook protein FlgE